jgi:transcriptional regulator with XRE-family HTH domain
MAEGDSPTVARRRVRLAIREARDAAGLTQNQVAEAMEWSHSKVIRIESGEVGISQNDLKPLLSYLGVKDKAIVNSLVADARIARSRQRDAWHQATKYREHLSEVLRSLIEYEAKAVAIRYYSIYFIPGTLQTPEYAAALLDLFGDEIQPAKREALLEARRLRHEALLARVGDVQLFVLLDESVLRRPLGGPAVFAAQLRELLRVADARLARIRMVPFSQEAPLTNNATFDLLSLDEHDEDEMVLYYENGMTDALDELKATTSRHRSRFDRVWNEAAAEEDTIDFIRGRIKDLEATITNRQGERK